ncbi:MAG: histidine kinase dimerization/phosphoacceptor domain-containing protein [Chloroflexi bacterium]|nr:histidine kinase dimerization/phosphoacceptor domain-containing protein [Chloroflexota bacterium]
MTRRPPALDVAIAAVLAVAMLIELALNGAGRAGTVGASALAVGLAGALAWRRTAPLFTVACVIAVVVAWATLQRQDDLPATAIAAVMLAGHAAGSPATRRQALIGAAAIVVLAVATPIAAGGPLLEYTPFMLVLAGIPWIGGRLTRRHADRAARLADLAAELERARAEHERLAVLAERARIAAELNDAVAHSLAEILIQVGAAAEVLTSDPDSARGVLRAVQDRGREALIELRRMLMLMRARPARPAD